LSFLTSLRRKKVLQALLFAPEPPAQIAPGPERQRSRRRVGNTAARACRLDYLVRNGLLAWIRPGYQAMAILTMRQIQ